MRGWGSEDTMLQPAHAATETPRGLSTALIASPSGMLCTAIATTMATASVIPPPKATPTATPSAKECTVITTSTRIMRRAPAPCTTPNPRLRSRRNICASKTNSTPITAPMIVCHGPKRVPSATSPKLAPSIRPDAIALE